MDKQFTRWRLILGSETEESFSGMGGGTLSQDELLMDSALAAIYGGPGESFGGGGAGRGPSAPHISKWLGDLRSLFDPELVAGDDKTTISMGIAAVNLEKGVIEDVHLGIVPEGTIMFDIIAPGADTDFVFWGYDGIFTYNIGEESAVNILPAYEAPCTWEGCEYCALPDGRLVFLDCTEYRMENEQIAHRIPEKTCFYYKSGLRNGR